MDPVVTKPNSTEALAAFVRDEERVESFKKLMRGTDLVADRFLALLADREQKLAAAVEWNREAEGVLLNAGRAVATLDEKLEAAEVKLRAVAALRDEMLSHDPLRGEHVECKCILCGLDKALGATS